MRHLLLGLAVCALPLAAHAQQKPAKPEDTEVWTPVPKIITPGATAGDAPSDAIVLFGGKNLDEWVSQSGAPTGWTVSNGIVTVNKQSGDMHTRRKFTNFQLHLEWRVPVGVTGSGQARGNSGVFLASTENTGYEFQILDSFENTTYVNGQAASIYKQSPPLVNAMRKQGEWQAYDIIWTAPTFNADGTVATPARVTGFHNGVLVQNNFVLKGGTEYIGTPVYKAHGPASISIQAHGDPSPPINFRNIWLRELN